jgi:uncharacterized protein (TIGR00255 family)
MTGYGRGDAARNGCRVALEIAAVNRKQLELNLNLPREIEPLEPRIRDTLQRRVTRGRLSVRLTLDLGEDQWAARVRLNTPLARAYARELANLANTLGIAAPLTLDALLRIPGIVQPADESNTAESFWPAVETALDQALDRLLRMRQREGNHLGRDLQRRVTLMRRAVTRIQRHAPAVARRYRAQLVDRIRTAGLDLDRLDDERLLKEVVFFADRSDITEELTRLHSHFRQFDDCRKSADPVGRTLDFLAQEMNREINTIGSKANDAAISKAVVTLKTELEKFREQVQNVE